MTGLTHEWMSLVTERIAEAFKRLDAIEGKPALTGAMVKAAVEAEIDIHSYGIVDDNSEYASERMRALAWDRVAARLVKP